MTENALDGSLRRPWAAARLCTRVEMASLLSDPMRPSAVLVAAASLVLAVLWWPTFAMLLPWGPALLCSAMAGLAVGFLVWAGQQLATAWWGFRRADRMWWHTTPTSGAAAYANQSAPGVWHLSCVCATPRGHGVGTALMQQIATQSHQDRIRRLELVAASTRVERFYRRLGYTADHWTLFGRAMHRDLTADSGTKC